ncbi:MAG: D-alanine--D-alanine ligase family protein [Flavobacteriales bacterium]|jgi:D-alanine-D-alanine ligase|nr:D-alanine--D-alanine ligase family protein [Flavobacteriales bacterium]
MSLPLIAILRGGYTGESVISMQSARTMMEAVDPHRYEAVYVTVERAGWTCERADGTVLPFDRGLFTADRGQGHERFAAALIAIHGTPGEDGKLQGYLDMLEVPYQTGGVLCMALTMSKYATTGLLRQMGFPVAPALLLHGRDDRTAQQVVDTVGLPCFVKPDGSGSSLGISKVMTMDELGPALELAFAEGPAVMCEALVQGRELTCGVVRLRNEVIALPLCEVRTPRAFFDYHAKYHDPATEELVPAPVPDALARVVQERSRAIYTALGCNGMVRVDHFWKDPGSGGHEVVTIEVNTTPGFSAASIFPKMLHAAGIGTAALVNGLVDQMLQP